MIVCGDMEPVLFGQSSQQATELPPVCIGQIVTVADRAEFILKTRMQTTKPTVDKGDAITSSDSAADKATEAAETMALPTTHPAIMNEESAVDGTAPESLTPDVDAASQSIPRVSRFPEP